MRGNGSLSAWDTQEWKESNFSDPKKENSPVGCRQITTNEFMCCLMVKLSCSHAEESKTRMIVSTNWAEKNVNTGREKKRTLLVSNWTAIRQSASHYHTYHPSRQLGQGDIRWPSVECSCLAWVMFDLALASTWQRQVMKRWTFGWRKKYDHVAQSLIPQPTLMHSWCKVLCIYATLYPKLGAFGA